MDYREKASRSRDPRFGRILDLIGYKRRDMRAAAPAGYLRSDETAQGAGLDELRAAYRELKGRAPGASWDEDKLRRLIDEAKA